MKFECTHVTGKKHSRWTGEITSYKGNDKVCEFEMQSRGIYYHSIIVTHDYGRCIYITNLKVGCEIADCVDYFWNIERLSKKLKIADAITLATAIREIKALQ